MEFNFRNFDFNFDKMSQKPSKNMGPMGTVLALGIVLGMFALVQYFYMVPMNLRNPGFIILLMLALGAFYFFNSALTKSNPMMTKVIFGLVGLLGVYLMAGQISGHPIFHAEDYRSQLILNENANFYEDNQSTNFDQIPVVDRVSAMRLGDRKMGEIMDYVSQFDVASDYTQINYQGRPVRVTPLNYSGIIKWFNNFSEGLPAYIIVDMVSQEAEVVRLDEKMKYSQSDKFFRNIYRHLFVNYPTLMFEEISFEIDETGIPYFIAPVYEYEIGIFGGKDIVGAVLVNAVSGDHQYYDVTEVPTWIDRVYPEPLAMTQLTNYGQYVNGFLNVYFGQKGVLQPTEGYNYVVIEDDVYLYTGLTSVMADESNVGFALINLRTKEGKFYNIPGAEEYSAQLSAQGLVQDLGYVATFPILINCNGEPTYFMALKDGSDLVKQYAFVSVQNYTVVATGTTIAEAQKSYIQALGDAGTSTGNVGNTTELTGVIDRFTSVVIEGNTRFYFTFVDNETIFIAPASLSDVLPLCASGDTLTITYFDTGDSSVIVHSVEK